MSTPTTLSRLNGYSSPEALGAAGFFQAIGPRVLDPESPLAVMVADDRMQKAVDTLDEWCEATGTRFADVARSPRALAARMAALYSDDWFHGFSADWPEHYALADCAYYASLCTFRQTRLHVSEFARLWNNAGDYNGVVFVDVDAPNGLDLRIVTVGDSRGSRHWQYLKDPNDPLAVCFAAGDLGIPEALGVIAPEVWS